MKKVALNFSSPDTLVSSREQADVRFRQLMTVTETDIGDKMAYIADLRELCTFFRLSLDDFWLAKAYYGLHRSRLHALSDSASERSETSRGK